MIIPVELTKKQFKKLSKSDKSCKIVKEPTTSIAPPLIAIPTIPPPFIVGDYVKVTTDMPPTFKYQKHTIFKIVKIVNNWIRPTVGSYSGININSLVLSTKEAFDQQELIKYAKLNYPVGTKYRVAHLLNTTDVICTISNSDSIGMLNNSVIEDDATAIKHAHNYTAIIYSSSIERWAKRFLFTTEDNVDIFEDETYYLITFNSIYDMQMNLNDWKKVKITDHKIFSTRKLAQQYLDSLKVKTLNDYENILLIASSPLFKLLKKTEPKLYWTKVLQLIADDLNGEWEYIKGNTHYYYIYYQYYYRVGELTESVQSTIKFNNRKNTQKALELMGDMLDHIYS
jgi:hypothetical protein